MKKRLMGVIALMLIVSISLFGCSVSGKGANVQEQQEKDQEQSTESVEKVITNLITDFGSKLQNVSLLAPEESVKKSIEENYGDFISSPLLSKWMNNSEIALGRLVSSPWPDRIEVLSIVKVTENTYEVKGEIKEVTSVEKAQGGVAAKRPITLKVKKINNHWLIDDVTMGDYEEANSIVYKNSQYGFHFSLPKSWKDFQITTEKWEGLALDSAQGEKVVETGPMVLIRHPEWTLENQRQDIPIMIFTLKQWESLLNEQFHIGAAPIGPRELGRNSNYVFALPARYNFAFPTGYEEVEKILNDHALQPTENME
ncbi:hypothetical protein ACFSO7_12535 [Bacillus sp. CGMCC 1.16607]|uniref:hypothetical protein n=1 Tax=Bacillus sp. CGMCC 1.16607 TaxID=3351842 RepID=UPI00362BE778